MLRRGMMRGAAGPGLGEYTMAYTAMVTPTTTSKLTITHNLGVLPKLVIVEMADEPTLASYSINFMVTIVEGGLTGDETGTFRGMYYYNGAVSGNAGGASGAEKYTATETEVQLSTVNISSRSQWDTGARYYVQIYA